MCWRRRNGVTVVADLFFLSILLFSLNLLIRNYGVKNERTSPSAPDNAEHNCTMKQCFDFSRCRGPRGFKVYVYPSEQGLQRSKLFEEILSIIRNSVYVTMDPEEACLLIPSIDTLDRDKHSDDFVDNIPSLDALPHWNGGRNHLLFVQYSGTWPDYSEQLDFPIGQAILARASFGVGLFRTGFDISLPLMHKEHPPVVPHHSGVLSRGTKPGFLPVKRKYLLVFKGKRYLYGQGSRMRSSLYHLHNGKDVIMLTTCKHNQDWVKYTDDRCDMDNALYDRYEYDDLMNNSSFCLIPRGRRLGSYRFLEALQSSCIPVSLSNGYILPFSEVLDWSQASLTIDERQLLQLPYLLRGIPSSKVLGFRLRTQFMWDTYFSSVSKIITTTLQIIHDRVIGQPSYMWNRPPGHLQIDRDFSVYPPDYPSRYHQSSNSPSAVLAGKFTAVITVSRPALRDSSPVLRLLQTLGKSTHLAAVVVLWAGQGEPQITTSRISVPFVISKVNLEGHRTQSLWPSPHINTSAVLHLNEDTLINSDEADFGFSAWQAFPSRLLGFIGHTHSWDDIKLQWVHSLQPHNYISMVTTDALFYHRYYGYVLNNLLPPKVRILADQSLPCLNVVLNFIVSVSTLAPPLKLPWTGSVSSSGNSASVSRERVACLNLAANAFGHMPLLYSSIRLDPVLYKDSVSMLRKEYRKMEVAGS